MLIILCKDHLRIWEARLLAIYNMCKEATSVNSKYFGLRICARNCHIQNSSFRFLSEFELCWFKCQYLVSCVQNLNCGLLPALCPPDSAEFNISVLLKRTFTVVIMRFCILFWYSSNDGYFTWLTIFSICSSANQVFINSNMMRYSAATDYNPHMPTYCESILFYFVCSKYTLKANF